MYICVCIYILCMCINMYVYTCGVSSFEIETPVSAHTSCSDIYPSQIRTDTPDITLPRNG